MSTAHTVLLFVIAVLTIHLAATFSGLSSQIARRSSDVARTTVKEELKMATTLTSTFECDTDGIPMTHTVTTTKGNAETTADFVARHKADVIAAKGALCD